MGKSSTSTSTNNQNSTQTYTPTGIDQFKDLFNRISNVASTPYQSYGGNLVAGLTPTQQSGIDQISSGANAAQPYINTAANYVSEGASPISSTDISRYYNPFQQSVIDATMGNIREQNAQQEQSLRGNAVSSGGLGNSRFNAVAIPELRRQQNLAAGQTLSGLNAQNYTQALAAAQADRAAKQQAGYAEGNIGTLAQGAQLQGGQAKIGAGTLQQQTNQAGLTSAYQQFLQSLAYPFQTTQFLAGLGIPALSAQGGTQTGVSSGTSTSTQPGPSGLSMGLGGLSLLGGLFGADGGRVSYNDGGEVGYADGGSPFDFTKGLPFSGSTGWVPSIQMSQIQQPKFADMMSRSPQMQSAMAQQNPFQYAQQMSQLGKKFGGNNNSDMWNSDNSGGSEFTGTNDATAFNDFGSMDFGLAANGGRIGFAGGGEVGNGVSDLINTAMQIKSGLKSMMGHNNGPPMIDMHRNFDDGGTVDYGPEFNDAFGWQPDGDRTKATSITGYEPGSALDKTAIFGASNLPSILGGRTGNEQIYADWLARQGTKYPTTQTGEWPEPAPTPGPMPPLAQPLSPPRVLGPQGQFPIDLGAGWKKPGMLNADGTVKEVPMGQPPTAAPSFAAPQGEQPFDQTTPDPQPFGQTSGPPMVANADPARNTVARMQAYIGMTMHNPQQKAMLLDFVNNGGINLTRAQYAWCADWVNSARAQEGLKTGNAAAQSLTTVGPRVEPGKERVGDVVTWPGNPAPHTGVVSGISPNGMLRVLSGNTVAGGRNSSVGEQEYPPGRLNIFRGDVRSGEPVNVEPRNKVPGSEAYADARRPGSLVDQVRDIITGSPITPPTKQTLFGRPMTPERRAMLAFGFGTLAGTSPFAAVNIGHGGAAALQAMDAGHNMTLRENAVDMAAKRLLIGAAEREHSADRESHQWYPGNGPGPDGTTVPGMYRLPNKTGPGTEAKPEFFPGQTITGRTNRNPLTDDMLRTRAASQAELETGREEKKYSDITNRQYYGKPFDREKYKRDRTDYWYKYFRAQEQGVAPAEAPPGANPAPPAAPAGAAKPTVKTKAERDALPPNTEYIGPDGKTYIKQ